MDRNVSRRTGRLGGAVKPSLREHTFSAQEERVGCFSEFVRMHAPKVGDSFSVVDIGCGSGEHSLRVAQLFPLAKIYAFDISPGNIKKAKALAGRSPEVNRIQFICGDYLECCLPPAALIISDSCVQLIPCEDTVLLAKLKESLIAGGRAIFTVPYDCFYNNCFYLLRRIFKAIRSDALERAVLRCARLVYGKKHSDAFLRQRLPYLYLLPARIDNMRFRRILEVHGLKIIYTQNETIIFGKPAHRYLVVERCHD